MSLLAWRRGQRAGPEAAVLLHGWAQDAAVWDSWEAALEEAGLTALACDLPGHGDSAQFAAPRGADLARWSAQAIIHDLETFGVTDLHLVGFAEGGMVAAHLALALPARRTVLVDPDPDWPAARAGEAAAALRDPAARLWSQEASDLVARARASGRAHDRLMLAAWLEQASWPAPARLRSIATPVLVVVGADDQERARAPRLAALLGSGRLATVPGESETLLAAGALRETVVAFLTERPQ